MLKVLKKKTDLKIEKLSQIHWKTLNWTLNCKTILTSLEIRCKPESFLKPKKEHFVLRSISIEIGCLLCSVVPLCIRGPNTLISSSGYNAPTWETSHSIHWKQIRFCVGELKYRNVITSNTLVELSIVSAGESLSLPIPLNLYFTSRY